MRRAITAVVVLAVGALGVTACSDAPTASQPSVASSKPAPPPAPAPKQSVVPFTGLERPDELAVDSEGNVYLTDITPDESSPSNRVIEWEAASKTQQTLPFTRSALLAGPSGEVWIIGGGQQHSRLLKLAPVSDPQTALPMPYLGIRGDILALDKAGNVYGVTGGGEAPGGGCCIPVHVVKDAPGSTAPEVLPFQYVDGLGGMATDAAGKLYVGDGRRKRVLALAPGATNPSELPFTELQSVIDIAVDSAGDVYVVDGQRNEVLKLSAGADKPTVLPFAGLNRPTSVAVNDAGDVYVVDSGNHRVVELKGA
jgi:DNA-binding beta-propeller fold protein YncE